MLIECSYMQRTHSPRRTLLAVNYGCYLPGGNFTDTATRKTLHARPRVDHFYGVSLANATKRKSNDKRTMEKTLKEK